MKKMKSAIGVATFLGVFLAGSSYTIDRFFPEKYEIEVKNGVHGIYDREGRFYVATESPKQPLKYLLKEDPILVRKALSELEKEVYREAPR